MTETAVAPEQRHNRANPCRICGGEHDLPRGRGVRCYGYTIGDFTVCTRIESPRAAGNSGGWTHWLAGPCDCGLSHGNPPPPRLGASSAFVEGSTPSANKNGSRALAIWRETVSAPGTPVERYLAARGLDGPLPPTLRSHARLRHSSGVRLPAMVAGAQCWPGREIVAVHRTYLSAEGLGKAAVEPTKMMLGPVGGGAVRLAPAAKTLVLAEGIETALAVQQATGIATWAALSAPNLAAVILPELPLATEVVIAADPDEAGFRSARAAADRWVGEGRIVRIAAPPVGLDFNDLLLRAP